MNILRNARLVDIESINELLKSEHLTRIEENSFTDYYFVCEHDSTIIANIGLEIYENYGLLRSLVVESQYRNAKIASQLLEKILSTAKDLQLDEIYLLTTTAENYFQKKGFEKICRENAPEPIKKSAQFSGNCLCPTSSTVMKKSINL